MCVPNNTIELQAYHFSEKIQAISKYEVVRVNFIGGSFLEGDKARLQGIENLPLIKNLILQSKSGKQYRIEPDELGLLFAKGELSYSQYHQAKKKNYWKMFCYTSGFTVLFTTAAWVFISHFL